MRLSSPGCDLQEHGDLLVCLTLRQEANDFDLTRSRSGGCSLPSLAPGFRVEKSVQDDVGYFGGEEPLSFTDGEHCLCEVVREIGFQKVPAGSCVQCLS